ncbi:MAG: hypothetical protein ACI35Q_09515 [Marinilabiliaceae bacterium]
MAQASSKRLNLGILSDTADKYYDIAVRIKELEAEIKPLRDALVEACSSRGVEGSMQIGPVLISATTRTTQKLNQDAVTPDWLYRYRLAGGVLSAKLDVPADERGRIADLLDEVGYSESKTKGYTLKLVAQ